MGSSLGMGRTMNVSMPPKLNEDKAKQAATWAKDKEEWTTRKINSYPRHVEPKGE